MLRNIQIVSHIYIHIQDYYKRNRHFQCCTETKYVYEWFSQNSYIFVVHVFTFIWGCYKCSTFEPFVTRQISIRQSSSVQTDLSISSSTLATAVVMSRALTLYWRHEKNAWKQIFIFPLRYYTNYVHYANGFDNVESVRFVYSSVFQTFFKWGPLLLVRMLYGPPYF
jgi:hypothetical protein